MTYGQLLLAFLAMSVSIFAVAGDDNPQHGSKNIGHNAVVVELFTSEGCSTCPPADEFLARLSARQPIRDVEIIALEEHVDYWNHEGWFDPFSSVEWTLRHQDYAARLSGSGTYTPQMVIDGQREMVGTARLMWSKQYWKLPTEKKRKLIYAQKESAGVELGSSESRWKHIEEVPIAIEQRSGLPSRKEISDRPSAVGRMPEGIYRIPQYCEPCARSA